MLAAGVLGGMSTNAVKSYLFPILDQLVPQMKYAKASDDSLYSRKERIYKIVDQLLDAASFAGGVVANSYGRAGVESRNNLLAGGTNPAIAFAHFLLSHPGTLLAIAAVPAALDAVLHYMPNAAVAAVTADKYESYEAKPWKERLSKIGDILKSAAHWNFKGPKEAWGGNVDHSYRSLNLGASTAITIAIAEAQKTLPYLQLNPMAAIAPTVFRLGQATARDWTVRRLEHRARGPADLETGGRVLGEVNEHGHIVDDGGNVTGVFRPTRLTRPAPPSSSLAPIEALPPIDLSGVLMPAATTTSSSHPVIMSSPDTGEPVKTARSASANSEDLARAIGIESEPPSIIFREARGLAPAALSTALERFAGRATVVEPTSFEMTTFTPPAESSRATAKPVIDPSRAQTQKRSRSVSPTPTEPEIVSTTTQPHI
ncbi:MAG TPA: hypothetical protein VM571_00655, partial [Noviherbaspirillum sp.]|nr:hypothetical protein [Noviherbaspirillum sp.]